MVNPEVIWKGDPITVIVDPSYMLIRRYGSESDERNHLAKDFHGSVEILDCTGREIAEFSGSDEYSGSVENVFLITRKRYDKYPDDLSLSTVQLWTVYRK